MKMVWFMFPFLVVACDSSSSVKVYKHDYTKQGFERKQEKEFLTYEQADGYFAMSPGDMEFMLNKLANCRTNDGLELDSEEIETYIVGQGL